MTCTVQSSNKKKGSKQKKGKTSNKTSQAIQVARTRVVVIRDYRRLIPEKWCTQQYIRLVGVSAASTSTPSWAFVFLNTDTANFQTTQNVTTVTASNGFGCVLNNSSNISRNPTGYTIFSSLYANYKVQRAKLVIFAYPARSGATTSTADVGLVTVGYSGNDGLQASTLNPQAVAAYHGYKELRFGSYGPIEPKSSLVSNISMAAVLGMTQKEYDDLPPVASNTSPPAASAVYANLNWYITEGASNANAFCWDFELTLDVDWSSPIPTSLES